MDVTLIFGGTTGEPGATLVGPPGLGAPKPVAVPLVNVKGVKILNRACSAPFSVRMTFDAESGGDGKTTVADAVDTDAKRKANPEMQQPSSVI